MSLWKFGLVAIAAVVAPVTAPVAAVALLAGAKGAKDAAAGGSGGLTGLAVDLFMDRVQPVPGSVVYTDLFLSYAEHSGIYVGNGLIAELNGAGNIELVTRREFMQGGTGQSIYVSSCDGQAIGDPAVASRARSMVGSTRDYNILLDNCHQFSSGCLTGNFENSDNFLAFLKTQSEKSLGANEWRVWGENG